MLMDSEVGSRCPRVRVAQFHGRMRPERSLGTVLRFANEDVRPETARVHISSSQRALHARGVSWKSPFHRATGKHSENRSCLP